MAKTELTAEAIAVIRGHMERAEAIKAFALQESRKAFDKAREKTGEYISTEIKPYKYTDFSDYELKNKMK